MIERVKSVLLRLPGAGFVLFLIRIQTRLVRQNTGLLSAGIAFYGLLSIFPAITASVAIAGAIAQPEDLLAQSEWIAALLPTGARSIVMGQLTQVVGAETNSLSLAALVALAIALWSASRAMGSLIQGLNVTFGLHEDRNFLWLRALNILLTVLLIVTVILAILLVAALPAVARFFGDAPLWAEVALYVRWPILFFVGVVGIAVLYRLGPDHRQKKERLPGRVLTPGAAIACVFWVIGSLGFSAYVQGFGTYNQTFGALAGVIVLLTWLWLSAFVILLGAQIDAEMTQPDANRKDAALTES